MGFGRYLPFLALGILVLYQMGVLQAAPISSEPASPEEEERDRFMSALVKEMIKKVLRKRPLVAQYPSSSSWKRACNTGTCLTHKLASLLGQYGNMSRLKLLPYSMVAAIRKGRNVDAYAPERLQEEDDRK